MQFTTGSSCSRTNTAKRISQVDRGGSLVDVGARTACGRPCVALVLGEPPAAVGCECACFSQGHPAEVVDLLVLAEDRGADGLTMLVLLFVLEDEGRPAPPRRPRGPGVGSAWWSSQILGQHPKRREGVERQRAVAGREERLEKRAECPQRRLRCVIDTLGQLEVGQLVELVNERDRRLSADSRGAAEQLDVRLREERPQ